MSPWFSESFSKSRNRSCVQNFSRWAVGFAAVSLCIPAWARTVPLHAQPGKSSRWLDVVAVREAIYIKPPRGQWAAQVGDRLQFPGEQIKTSATGEAQLRLDDGIGQLHLGSTTTLLVKRLEKRSDGGKVTYLQILGGQCVLTLRKLTHPHSSVSVQTPAAIAGVRGTVFGITANRIGLTAIATQRGKVVVTGQGKSVTLYAGEQSLAMPGQPPTPPRPLIQNAYLFDVKLTWVSVDTVRLEANTDPGNLVQVSGIPLDLGIDGRIETTVKIAPDLHVLVEITTPLGKQKVFPLTVLLSEKPKA